jgi:hypothetical protein
MPTIEGRPRLRGADHRLLRGYGPLVGLVVCLFLVAFLVPTVQPEERRITTTDSSQGTTSDDGSGGGTDDGAVGATGSDGAGSGRGGPGGTPPGAEPCAGRQVEGDPYSPACVAWAGGDNGGETSRGVDADSITVTLRETALANIGELVNQLTGGKVQVNETLADVERTYRVLIEYFNQRYQFYGRKIEIKFFKGQGDLTVEALGGGQAEAQADAVNAAQQQKAFAETFSLTQPYSEALVSQKVIALNGLYFSEDWFREHAPYAFSLIPDCTKVVEATADFVIKALKGRPAEYAGGDLKGRPRKIALIAPDNPLYQSCARAGLAKMRAGGVEIADVRSYPLDINSLTNTTPQNLVSALSGEGITTVILSTDPVLPFFMTSKAELQEWSPEWVLTGVGLTDADYVGQLMQQDQWRHAFGVSFLAKQQPVRASDAYYAYKSVDPNTTIAELTGQIIYYALQVLAIGIQGAGPNLTPETFMQGLQRFPGGTGQAGTWQFTAEHPFTPNVDGRIVWWNPTGTSSYNGAPGTYDDNGMRYPFGGFPEGPPPVYLNGGP